MSRERVSAIAQIMYYRSIGISIRQTPIGRGVFARKSFRKGKAIGEMSGEVIVGDDYDPAYVVDLEGKAVLEPAAPFRFLNHSCEPNAELLLEEVEGEEFCRVWVQATRGIRLGDQITIDYAWPAEAQAIRCGCGAATCRGWVVDQAQVKKLERLLRVGQSGKGRTKRPGR